MFHANTVHFLLGDEYLKDKVEFVLAISPSGVDNLDDVVWKPAPGETPEYNINRVLTYATKFKIPFYNVGTMAGIKSFFNDILSKLEESEDEANTIIGATEPSLDALTEDKQEEIIGTYYLNLKMKMMMVLWKLKYSFSGLRP